jgi:hypothetical protein
MAPPWVLPAGFLKSLWIKANLLRVWTFPALSQKNPLSGQQQRRGREKEEEAEVHNKRNPLSGQYPTASQQLFPCHPALRAFMKLPHKGKARRRQHSAEDCSTCAWEGFLQPWLSPTLLCLHCQVQFNWLILTLSQKSWFQTTRSALGVQRKVSKGFRQRMIEPLPEVCSYTCP